MRKILLLLLTVYAIPACAQYAPQVGVAGSTAINKSSASFVGWAKTCSIHRGWMHIEDKPLGKAVTGDSSNGVNAADNYNVSLGDSGVAVLTFDGKIYNGNGPDFAVFENGFPNPGNPEQAFLELAFVEVSSDGINYTRFPSSSLTDTPQIPVAGVFMDARKINNLAGKYIANYGTPFDLQELAGTQGLDVNNITHIRIVDVIGSIKSRGSLDKDGNIINDPYPTPVPGSGFDLDAVGAFYIKGKFPNVVANIEQPVYDIYPNPVSDRIIIRTNETLNISVADVTGKMLTQTTLNMTGEISFMNYTPGMYYITLTDTKGNKWVEKLSKL